MEHRAGRDHDNADCLSWRLCDPDFNYCLKIQQNFDIDKQNTGRLGLLPDETWSMTKE